jgi:phenylalanyl-tRNA synthetase beta chain
MKVLLSWIRELVDVTEPADVIGARMSLRGLALEGIEQHGEDAVLDFDVTSNRPDCLSIQGIAREIATAYQLPLKSTAFPVAKPASAPVSLPVSIHDRDLCSRYVAAVANVRVGPSPEWMQARLTACGQRPINNIVDITNYVLLELGYPMHAFDCARLSGPEIVVRRARPGERITTLDGKGRQLEPEMLVIADAERAQAIGGVMGGADSEVTGSTERVVFEAAWFDPRSVRATSKRLGLRTEASYRFERGADLSATARAMARALQLLEQIAAGTSAGPIVDCYPVPYVTRELTLDPALVQRVLGMSIPEDEMTRILVSLGFAVEPLGSWQAVSPEAPLAAARAHPGRAWRVQVPGWRIDVQRPVDLVEEVGRHYGFEHLTGSFPPVEQPPAASDVRLPRDARVRSALVAMGISEAVTFAFIEHVAAEPFLRGQAAVTIANPLTEKFTTLRPGLLPGLIDAVSHNRRHGRRDVRLFEIGTRFSPSGEARNAAIVWTGLAVPEHWSGGARAVDFFDLKGIAERLCATMNLTCDFVAAPVSYLIDGRSAEVHVDGHPIGVCGQLRESIAERRDLPPGDPVFVLEIDLDALSQRASQAPRFASPLPRHPSVVRDIAILVADTLSAETVRGTIRAAGPSTLVDIREFDRYQGKGIPEGQVSLALRLTFQAPDRTLTDAEVQTAMQRIVVDLTSRLGAIQR